MWRSVFAEISNVENPGARELERFIKGVLDFLGHTLADHTFSFLWSNDTELHRLARRTFDQDIRLHTNKLLQEIKALSPHMEARFVGHGLVGMPMRFKLAVLNSVASQWEQVKGQFSIREWLKRMFEAIDAILDSLIDAVGGVGAILGDFKDALSALVNTAKDTRQIP